MDLINQNGITTVQGDFFFSGAQKENVIKAERTIGSTLFPVYIYIYKKGEKKESARKNERKGNGKFGVK